MRLLMVSGDRQTPVGEQGPFYSMQAEFSRWFERIDVICPQPPKPPTVHCVHDNVYFHPADCGRAKMAGFVARRGRELLAEHGHKLIVSHDYGWFYNGLGSARLAQQSGVPYLSEIHHVPGYPVAADWREKLDRLIARTYVRWARSRARAFRVVNRGEMPSLLLAWGVREEQILVLPSLYIDLEVFRPKPAPIVRDLCFVGRMVANKGLARLVDALSSLNKRGIPVRTLFLGRGPLRADTEARIQRAGLGSLTEFVDWVDTADDLADIYRGSRAVVCASTCEGGPRVTVEAMACGVPAISTRVGVMGELLEDGRAGTLVPFAAAGLERGIEAVLADEAARVQMGLVARGLAEQYEYAEILAGYARGLHELVGEECVRH